MAQCFNCIVNRNKFVKNENELIFRVYVDTVNGDDIKVNLPYLSLNKELDYHMFLQILL